MPTVEKIAGLVVIVMGLYMLVGINVFKNFTFFQGPVSKQRKMVRPATRGHTWHCLDTLRRPHAFRFVNSDWSEPMAWALNLILL
jgi:hypothetical protein